MSQALCIFCAKSCEIAYPGAEGFEIISDKTTKTVPVGSAYRAVSKALFRMLVPDLIFLPHLNTLPILMAEYAAISAGQYKDKSYFSIPSQTIHLKMPVYLNA